MDLGFLGKNLLGLPVLEIMDMNFTYTLMLSPFTFLPGAAQHRLLFLLWPKAGPILLSAVKRLCAQRRQQLRCPVGSCASVKGTRRQRRVCMERDRNFCFTPQSLVGLTPQGLQKEGDFWGAGWNKGTMGHFLGWEIVWRETMDLLLACQGTVKADTVPTPAVKWWKAD